MTLMETAGMEVKFQLLLKGGIYYYLVHWIQDLEGTLYFSLNYEGDCGPVYGQDGH